MYIAKEFELSDRGYAMASNESYLKKGVLLRFHSPSRRIFVLRKNFIKYYYYLLMEYRGKVKLERITVDYILLDKKPYDKKVTAIVVK